MSWIPLQHLLLAPLVHRTVAVAPDMDHAHFSKRCLATAGALQMRSVRRAGLWFDDAAELGIALLACWRAGVTAVLPGDAQRHTIAMLDPDIDLWLSNTQSPALPEGRTLRLSDLDSHAPLAAAALDPEAGAIELCTSGSSGRPKRITKSWDQLCHEVEALEHQWNWAGSVACVMGSASPQHMYGLPFRVLWPLCAGRSIGRTQLVYPEDLQAASLQHERVVWIASPALLRRLSDSLQWQSLARGIVQIFSSGGPLPTDLFDTLHDRLNCIPTEIYGSSETGAIAWRQSNSCWQPLPKVTISTSPNGALTVQSPWIALVDEQTDDAAQLEDGGFTLLGRLDRIVKIEEKRISLPMIEAALASHPYIAEARVGRATGMPRLTALAALSAQGRHQLRNSGRMTLVQHLQKHLSDRFEPLAIPRNWRFLLQIPWNTQNKLPQHDFDVAAGPRAVTPIIQPLETAGLVDERHYSIIIPLDLAHFSGHFSTTPIVPGVTLVGWAMMLAVQDMLPNLRFGGMEALKFQHLLRPGDSAALKLRWDNAKNKLYFDYKLADATCASGRIVAAN